MASDLNAARKRRAGLADTGMCKCDRFIRYLCREACFGEQLDDARERERRRRERPLLEILKELGRMGETPGQKG